MRRAALLLALLPIACGGGSSPSGPSLPSPTVTTVPAVTSVRDGVTGATVNATITPNGGSVTVSAPGYLTRTQPASAVVWLWQQPEEYVRALIYTEADSATRTLARWNTPARVAFAGGLERHDAFLSEMCAHVSAVTHMSIVALPSGDASANVTLTVDPSMLGPSALAQTLLGIGNGGNIASARVLFRSETNITGGSRSNTLLHELGHVVGLGHSIDSGDVMSVANNRRNERSFGDPERRALTMMYQWRAAGNQFPDNGPAFQASTKKTTVVYECPGL